MHSNFLQILNYIFNEVRCFCKERRSNIITFCVVILLGLLTGIIVSSVSEIEYSSINYLVLMGKGEYNIFGKFVKILLLVLLAFVIVFLTCMSKWCRFLPHFVLFYTAYRLGVRLVVTVLCDKLIGVICVFIFVLPVYIAILLAIITVACIVTKFCEVNGDYIKCSRSCRKNNMIIIKHFGVVFALVTIILVIFAIIIPLIVKFIIII